jgi:WD40 repeat protein
LLVGGAQRKLSARSDRVKSLDFHPTEPWVLTCLYNGNVYIWNYDNQVHTHTHTYIHTYIRACRQTLTGGRGLAPTHAAADHGQDV